MKSQKPLQKRIARPNASMHKTSNAQDLLTGVYLSSSFFFSNHQQHRSPFGIVFQTKVFLAFLNSFFSAFLNGLLNSFLKFLFLLLVLSTGWPEGHVANEPYCPPLL